MEKSEKQRIIQEYVPGKAGVEKIFPVSSIEMKGLNRIEEFIK